jgi:hypothetical protein
MSAGGAEDGHIPTVHLAFRQPALRCDMSWRHVSSQAAAALALGAGPQTDQRLQEGWANHRFDGIFPTPSVQIGLAQETLIGRCQAIADVFSGRRNPVWPLSPGAVAALRASISRGTTLAGDPQAEPGLGYRGVVIACSHRAGHRRLRIRCGTISWADTGDPIAFVPALDRDLLLGSPDRTARAFARFHRSRCL